MGHMATGRVKLTQYAEVVLSTLRGFVVEKSRQVIQLLHRGGNCHRRLLRSL